MKPDVRDDLGLLFYSRPRAGGFDFEVCELDISGDLDSEGQRFLVQRRTNEAATTASEVIVVENWASEFED